MQAHFAKLSNLRETANSMGMYRPFNRMAESPTIPFSETYVASSGLDRDLLRESLLYFNNHVPSGHLFGDKLEATLGSEAYERIALEYPHGTTICFAATRSSSASGTGCDFTTTSSGCGRAASRSTSAIGSGGPVV